MNFKSHDNYSIADGTALQGEFIADYADLVRAFGQPLPGDGYKTDAEWVLTFDDGTVATIYNWKNGHAYNDADWDDNSCFDLEYITEWHIGGRSPLAVTRVLEALVQ